MTFRVRPISDNLIVKQADHERVTAAGIVIPDTAEKPDMGEVVAVGPGELLADGTRAPMFVEVGDRILFAKTMYQDFRFEGVDYKAVKQRHCLGVL